jgi:hypothetical protein
MANSIVREREVSGGAARDELQGGARGGLVGEIMGDILQWRKMRDDDFEEIWDEYYAKWRGFWMPQHKSFKTERSKLISPLTAMAIDLTTAEIVEAVLGREYFIDLPDNIGDGDTQDVEVSRRFLVEDLKNAGFMQEFPVVALNGCLYGTGIMKLAVDVKMKTTLERSEEGELLKKEREVVDIYPVAIDPGAFVADPGARDIDMMKGCAHEFELPVTRVKQKQQSGMWYSDIYVGDFRARSINPNRGDTQEGNRKDKGETAYITEYYGLVPTRLFLAATAEGNGVQIADEVLNGVPEDDMTEVIATIANETHLLRVIENPAVDGQRLVMAYQHETVGNRFYGRGVAEKAASIQRAMDGEMRARMDALAWSNLPMFAGDLTRMPPNSNLNAWPGKFWGTRGNPNEILREFRISGPDQNSFAHMQELERMGQQATGALDSSGLRSGMRDETATGGALAASSFIKRSKRTMFNIEEFLNRLVRRCLHLKMQFEPEKYPQDYEFSVRGTIGIMAREIEQQQMVNLVSVLGPDSPASMPIIQAIFEHSGSPVKMEVVSALKASAEREPTPEEKAAQRAQLLLPIRSVEKLEAEIMKIVSESNLKDAQAEKTEEETENIDFDGDIKEMTATLEVQDRINSSRQLDIMEERNAIQREQVKIQEKGLKQKQS